MTMFFIIYPEKGEYLIYLKENIALPPLEAF